MIFNFCVWLFGWLIVSCYIRSFGRQKIRPTKQMREMARTRGDEIDPQTPTHIHLKYTNGFHRPSHLIPPDTIHTSPFSSQPCSPYLLYDDQHEPSQQEYAQRSPQSRHQGLGGGGGGWLTGFYADVKTGPVIFFVNLTCTDYQNPYPSCEC